jgi:hypothetical protein
MLSPTERSCYLELLTIHNPEDLDPKTKSARTILDKLLSALPNLLL